MLLLAVCMVTPLLSQAALASDGLGAEDPGNAVVLPGLDEESITVKPIGAGDTQPDLFDADVPTPYALTEGNRVLSIRAYPLAKDPDGNTTQYNTDPLNDYYYLGFTGEVYSTDTYGGFGGRSFAATVGFNSPNPTVPD